MAMYDYVWIFMTMFDNVELYMTMLDYVWLLGCVEKLKNTKSNYGYSYFIAPWYIETEKTWFFEFRDFLAWGVTASKFLGPLYKWKKNRSDYKVHGIQIDRLNPTVSMQKSVLKNMHRVPRYRQKCVKFWWFGLECRFWTVFS